MRFIRQIAERGMGEEEWKIKRGRRGREEQGKGQGVEDKVSICELPLSFSLGTALQEVYYSQRCLELWHGAV